MKLAGEGDFTQSISIQGNNEIAAMAQGYNAMLNKIQKLVMELEEAFGVSLDMASLPRERIATPAAIAALIREKKA